MTDILEQAREIVAKATHCDDILRCASVEFPCLCRGAARRIIDLAQRQERETCAKVADAHAQPNRFSVADCWKDNQSPAEVYDTAAIDVGGWIAQEIRARGLPLPPKEEQ